ncbi:MAG TPA: hypothetical protein DCY12_06610 [Candidatus Atribacteria bacterium]|nr:hypothetical protein [Candidatus Atribacteria bacterium]
MQLFLLYQKYLASGVFPQIAIMLASYYRGAAFSASMTDFVFVVEGIGCMFASGQGVIKASLAKKHQTEA